MHHSNVIEKRSFNGFPANNNNGTATTNIINNNNLSPTSFYSPQYNAAQSRSNNHLLTAPQTSHQSLRRCRSASPATSGMQQRLKHHHQQQQQQYFFGILLSHDQQLLIRKSWLKMPKATFGKAMFNQMIGACPSAARLFDSPADPAAAARHQRYFVELVQRAVDAFLRPTSAAEQSSSMEPERALGQWLEMVGQGHAQFKVSPAHWDCLGEALTDAICQWLPPGRHRRETVHAWRVLVSFISDRLGTQMPIGHGQNACPIHHPRIELLRLVTDSHPEPSP